MKKYLNELSEIEQELMALEPRAEIVARAKGDLDLFFSLYQKSLNEYAQKITQDASLNPLEKQSLIVYQKLIMANQIFRAIYTLKTLEDNSDIESFRSAKDQVIDIQNEIFELMATNKLPVHPNQNNDYSDSLKSFLLAIYAENLFYAINLHPLSFFPFAHESFSLFEESLRYDKNNYRAQMGYRVLYLAISDLSPTHLGSAIYHLEKIITDKELLKSTYAYDHLLVFNIYVWLVEAYTKKLDYEHAGFYLLQAERLYPKSGYLRLIKNLYAERRNLFIGELTSADGKADNNEDSRANFYYSYTIEQNDSFLFGSYFNFIIDLALVSPYIKIGASFYPFSLLAEEGLKVTYNGGYFGFGARQNPLFSDGVGHFTGVLDFGFSPSASLILLRVQYGQFFQYQANDIGFKLKNYHGISPEINVEIPLIHNHYNRWYLKQNLTYAYSFSDQVHLIDVSIKFPGVFFDHGFGEFFLTPGVDFSYSSKPSLYLNRTKYFKRTPYSLGYFLNRLNYYETAIDGVLLFHASMGYRFYPLMFMDDYSAAKGFFIAPSFHIGVALRNISTLAGDRPRNKVLSYSILGNIGYRFPGERTISAGAGWNNLQGIVFNIMMH